jgi:hypothetical protein
VHDRRGSRPRRGPQHEGGGGGELPFGPHPGPGLGQPLAAGEQQRTGGFDVEGGRTQIQADPSGIDPPPVADHDQGVGEFVDRDGGQGQADDSGNLGRVDPQPPRLVGTDRGGHRGQPGHGQDDLGGDRGRVEQVPGPVVIGGADQPVGAVPVHIERGGAGRDPAAGLGRRRVAGQEPLAGQLLEERLRRRIGLAGPVTGLQLVAEVCLGSGQVEGLTGAVVDQQLIAAAATARLLVKLRP